MSMAAQVEDPKSRSTRSISKKNGLYHVALLAGGPEDIYRELKKDLGQKRGIDLRYHWDWEKKRTFQGDLPKDVDFVLCLTDMLGHPDYYATRTASKQAGVPCLATVRKKVAYQQCLWSWGLTGLKGRSTSRDLLREAQMKERAQRPVEPEPPKLSVVPPQPEQLSLVTTAPLKLPEPLPVSIHVHQTSIPVSELPLRKQGIPRPETLALVAVLQAMASEDGVSILISGRELQISALASTGDSK